jgi:hypothetical protein
MVKNKIITRGILAVVVALFLLSSANAFAISAKYHEGNPLYILPGESKEVPFVLQNLGGTSDINIKLEMGTGREFLKIEDPSEVYVVPAGGKTSVSLMMSVPADAKVEEIYPVSLNFITLSNSESGAFSLTGAITQKFNAIIGTGIPAEEANISTGFIILVIAVALAIGAAFYYLAIRKKKKN